MFDLLPYDDLKNLSMTIKKTSPFRVRFVFALPIFPEFLPLSVKLFQLGFQLFLQRNFSCSRRNSVL